MRELLKMEIDLKQIKENIVNIQKEANKSLIPVIKSNAYNLGDLEIMKIVEELNLEYGAVVDMNEAISLLNHNPNFKILILNSLEMGEYEYLNEYPNIAITINKGLDILNFQKVNIDRKVKVHLQVDTGMNRLGFNKLDDFKNVKTILENMENIQIEGVYTHFSSLRKSSDQLIMFKEFSKLYPFKMVHLSASSTFRHIDYGNFVRVGLDVYGTNKQTQSIKITSYPISINDVKKGDTVGYDEAFVAPKDMKVAVLPIGYSNGFRRSLEGYSVMVEHKLYKIVGRVCMNHIFVEIDDSINIDSEFVITSANYPIEEMAKYLNTICHEILCMLNIKNKKYIR